MSRVFDGADDRVLVASYAAIQSVDVVSYACWAYRSTLGENNAGRVFDMGESAGDSLGVNSTVLYFFTAGRWNTTDGTWTFPVGTDPNTALWHHIVVTYDYGDTANNPVVYVNGEDVIETEGSTPAGTVGALTSDLYIGDRASSDRCYAGRLAEFAMWSGVLLTKEDARRLAGGVSPQLIEPASLVAYLPLTGTSSPERNLASPANSGVVTNTTAEGDPLTLTRRLFWPGGLLHG